VSDKPLQDAPATAITIEQYRKLSDGEIAERLIVEFADVGVGADPREMDPWR
jgi:hypothetical protein